MGFWQPQFSILDWRFLIGGEQVERLGQHAKMQEIFRESEENP
jgi:hypothetical protein